MGTDKCLLFYFDKNVKWKRLDRLKYKQSKDIIEDVKDTEKRFFFPLLIQFCGVWPCLILSKKGQNTLMEQTSGESEDIGIGTHVWLVPEAA